MFHHIHATQIGPTAEDQPDPKHPGHHFHATPVGPSGPDYATVKGHAHRIHDVVEIQDEITITPEDSPEELA